MLKIRQLKQPKHFNLRLIQNWTTAFFRAGSFWAISPSIQIAPAKRESVRAVAFAWFGLRHCDLLTSIPWFSPHGTARVCRRSTRVTVVAIEFSCRPHVSQLHSRLVYILQGYFKGSALETLLTSFGVTMATHQVVVYEKLKLRTNRMPVFEIIPF